LWAHIEEEQMLHKLLQVLTSLRLTVALLALALGLVFFGTLAQVKLGLYIVQEQFFGSWFVWWGPQGSSFKMPVYPGGYLLGGLLLINLIAAHIKRFELSRKKFGIFLVHAGLILLLVGQLLSQLFQVESYMAIEEGSQKNYSESGRSSELVVVDVTDPKNDTVVAIPQGLVAKRKEITHPSLPFKIHVRSFYDNADPKLEGGQIGFEERPFQVAMNKRNIPAANIEIVTDEGSKGTFAVSNWQTEKNLVQHLAESFARSFRPELVRPGRFEYKGRTYEVAMRPVRYYKPFTIQLLDFTHERYAGTEIPKNFSSRVRLVNDQTKENREVLIYMNNPLRYWGETYYQGGFEPGDTVSILQVVRNPSWLTPYIACALVSLGLLFQFLYHLIVFAKKRTA
jgi:hypothetical protein